MKPRLYKRLRIWHCRSFELRDGWVVAKVGYGYCAASAWKDWEAQP